MSSTLPAMDNLMDARDWLRALGCMWIVQAPLCLLTVVLLASGRVALSKADITRALTWTFAVSGVIGFPAVWALAAACAAPEIVARTPRIQYGFVDALMLFPAYWSLVAYVVFGFAVRAARKRGALVKPLGVRVASGLLLSGVVIVAATIVSFALGLALYGPRD